MRALRRVTPEFKFVPGWCRRLAAISSEVRLAAAGPVSSARQGKEYIYILHSCTTVRDTVLIKKQPQASRRACELARARAQHRDERVYALW